MLKQVMLIHTQGEGLPLHAHALASDQIVDVNSLWSDVKNLLQNLIIDKVEANIVDAIRKIAKRLGESDLEFLG